MKDIAIEIKDLNITYKNISAYSVKRSLFQLKKVETKLIHAINNVSFDIYDGEILGIIGRNGSGKSTLLNAIAGIFAPDSGTVDLHGNSVSLLSLGAGFQREITGRENIALSGILIGFSEQEIKEKSEEIMDFAELGDFIDMPVKTYSSGMKSKLAFAITAMLETNIILVDEVLSVGDTKFRKKSYTKMREIIEKPDRTAIIVSHQEETLRELCDRIMWLDKGSVKAIGDTNEILDDYVKIMK